MTAVFESVPCKRPKIVSDKGSQFIPEEWWQVVRQFELEEIPIRVRHPESNSKIERSHRSVCVKRHLVPESQKTFRRPGTR